MRRLDDGFAQDQGWQLQGEPCCEYWNVWAFLMPYPSNSALAPSVYHHLPPRAQDFNREALNDAWANHANDQRREEIAHRTAWVVAKRLFHKGAGGQWMPNSREGEPT